MKAFALGRRAKWKDYVDLYFILHHYYTIQEICKEAKKIFNQQFSEKLFRQQLAFHKDIDYTEPVEFITTAVPEDEIKEFLIQKPPTCFNLATPDINQKSDLWIVIVDSRLRIKELKKNHKFRLTNRKIKNPKEIRFEIRDFWIVEI